MPRLDAPAKYIRAMCGRVNQSSGPLRYAIVDGMNVRDSRVHNYPPVASESCVQLTRSHRRIKT